MYWRECDIIGDIFQSKVDDILGDIGEVTNYIDYRLVFIKESLYNHIYQLRSIFARLHASVWYSTTEICLASLKVKNNVE